MWCVEGCTKQCTLGTIGITLALLGFLMGIFWIDIFTLMLGKEMALTPTSRSYDPWSAPSIPLSLDIYFFNWTNPEDITDPTKKPVMQEVGPYRFTEKPEKVDIVWHPKNSSVSFKKRTVFYFDIEGSNGTLDDYISTLNVVAVSAPASVKHRKAFDRTAVKLGFDVISVNLTVLKTVDELLFTGYEDDMIDAAMHLNILPDMEVPFDRFGWFYTRNGSAELTGHFNMHTGENNIENIGKMNTWNYNKHSGFFDSYCGLVNGSAGEFYPPNLKVGEPVFLFTPDMCRTLRLDYDERVNIYGLEGFKFSGGLRSVDNGTYYPENECFCGGECVPSGVMNISACRFGTPVFMSYPHFYNADPFYVNQVIGVKPEKEKHEFYMVLEPTSGAAMEVAARFQVNVLVEEFQGIPLFKGVQKTFLPLLWFEQKVKLPRTIIEELKTVPLVVLCGHIIFGILFAIGLIMAFWVPIDNLVRGNRGELKKRKTPKTTEKYKASHHHHVKSASKSSKKKDVDGIEKGPECSLLLVNRNKNNQVAFTTSPSNENKNSSFNEDKEKL